MAGSGSQAIRIDPQAAAARAGALRGAAQSLGIVSFSPCASVSDAVAASTHDKAVQSYETSAQGYKEAVGRDANTLTGIASSFSAEDVRVARKFMAG